VACTNQHVTIISDNPERELRKATTGKNQTKNFWPMIRIRYSKIHVWSATPVTDCLKMIIRDSYEMERHLSILKMEAVGSSETLVLIYNTTRLHIAEDHIWMSPPSKTQSHISLPSYQLRKSLFKSLPSYSSCSAFHHSRCYITFFK
jgi:hypothetical protein